MQQVIRLTMFRMRVVEQWMCITLCAYQTTHSFQNHLYEYAKSVKSASVWAENTSINPFLLPDNDK